MRSHNWVSKLMVFGLALTGALYTLGVALTRAAEPKSSWQVEWEKTAKAAEQEGQLVLYAQSGFGEMFEKSDFQKKFPKIKVVLVSARGAELVSRIMAERRAGKSIADVGIDFGNDSPWNLYQAKVLEPVPSVFFLPEVGDTSAWWQGKHQYIDPEGKFIFVYAGVPQYFVSYNKNLVNREEFKSYWDLLNPKWKGKITAFDPQSSGYGATAARFFYHHPDLGPKFLRRFYREMDVTIYRQIPQGEDWLATGKFALCLCRHQSIGEAMQQGLPVDEINIHGLKEAPGLGSNSQTLILLNKAPHPNAARLFINWFLSKEGQTDFQNASANGPEGALSSLRMDVPKDSIPPRNRIAPGMKYVVQWNPDMFDMKPIRQLISEALAEGKKN
jgi:iron(III) transport system substrate-binding protein